MQKLTGDEGWLGGGGGGGGGLFFSIDTDPSVCALNLLKSFQKQKHSQSESVKRYLQKRIA